MLNYILIAIVIVSVGIFFYSMLFKKGNKNRFFLIYICILYPFIRINVIPSLIELTLFDFLVFSYYLFFYKSKLKEHIKNEIFNYSLFVLFLTILLGFILVNEFTKESFEASIQLLSISLYVKLLFEELTYNKEFIYEFVDTYKIPVLFSFIFLGCQLVFGVGFSISKQLNSNILSEVVVRYPSFFQDPQKYSQFLAATSFLMLINNQKQKKDNIVWILMSLISVICILFAGGRAGLSGWMFGIMIILFWGIPKYRKTIVATLVVLVAIAIAYSEKFSIFQRENLNDSYEFRMSIWEAAYNIFKDNPILGIGIGNYSNYVNVHNPDQFWIADNEIVIYDHPESGYLKLLTEFGIIGFIAILLFIVFPVIKGFFKYIKTKEMMLLFFVCSIISWMVGFYSVYSLGDVRITVLIASILCMLVSRINNKSTPVEIK